MCSRFLLFVNIINDRSFSFFSLALKKIDLSNYTLSLQAYSVDILHQYNDQPLSFHTVDMSHLSSRSYLWISLSTSPLLSLSWQLQVLPNGNVFSPGCKTCNVSCTSLSDDSWGIRFLNLEHRHTWMTTKMITTTEHMSNNYSLITKNLKHDLRWWMKHYLNNHLYISVSTYHQWILVMPTSVTVDLSLWHHFGTPSQFLFVNFDSILEFRHPFETFIEMKSSSKMEICCLCDLLSLSLF